MSVQLRLPNISGNDKEQLSQIRSYLYQIVPELQFALDKIGTMGGQSVISDNKNQEIVKTGGEASAQATFNSIKALIIKSADIVNAYYDVINRKLEGVYVAESDFGKYAEKTSQEIEENSTSTTQRFENIQVIITNQDSIIAEVGGELQETTEAINNSIQGVQDSVTGVNLLLEDAKAQLKGSLDDLTTYVTGLEEAINNVNSYIKSGLLYTTDEGIDVYGIEIGQTVTDGVSGEKIFDKYARFTSEKLCFYDSNGNEVAYISDKKLFIKMAEITVSLKIGGLIDLVTDTGDVVTKWVGG